jgi:predicted PurR-regulated permease PerM
VEDSKGFVRNALEASIRIAVVGALVVWTYQITRPFLMPVVWGGIIAIAADPLVEKVSRALGGKRRLVVFLLAVGLSVAFLVPLVMLTASSFSAVQPWVRGINRLHLVIPMPPESVNGWPVIGHEVSRLWTLLATNLGALLRHLEPHIKTAVVYFFGLISGGFKMMVIFLVSLFLAAVFLATPETSSSSAKRIVNRFAGEKGHEICEVSVSTIRGVMLGVVGVAVIQSVLAGVGMAVVGVPLAPLWAVVVLVCAVVQLPTILVTGPIAGWVFFTKENTTVSVLFLVWCVLVSISDNVMKPLLMGRGVDVPMLVILVGAIGGMLMSGIIGLFIGAVVLAIAYKLFMGWIHEDEEWEERLQG